MSVPSFDPVSLFRSVWRTTPDEPGWAVLIPPAPFDSHDIRREMLRVIDELSAVSVQHGFTPFQIERLGRFDQQVTTKFHRDGAPTASLLLLGYEPTTVRSRLFVADAYRAAVEAGLGLNAFLSAHNPMLLAGESKLEPFLTEVIWPHDRGAIVLVNNSLYPDDEPAGHPLGLLHKGLIESPDPSAKRVINSIGVTIVVDGVRPVSNVEVERFAMRADLD